MTKFAIADVAWRLGGVLALVLTNGFFVAAEFSIVAVRKTRVEELVARGVGEPGRFIGTALGATGMWPTARGLDWRPG